MSESDQSTPQEQTSTGKTRKTKNKRTVLTLALVTVLMFGFAFAMVPLYRLVCSVAGWNSISTNSTRALAAEVAAAKTTEETAARDITVQFPPTINGNSERESNPNVLPLIHLCRA